MPKPKPDKPAELTVRVARSIDEIDAAAWDALANPPGVPFDPFVTHRFFAAAENSGAISARTGWAPCHILLERGGTPVAAMPCYLKAHSLGEFVFDHGWADAYERHGLDYYPKLLSSVPVTPVPGRRLLIAPGEDADVLVPALLGAATTLCKRNKASSLHITFLTEAESTRLGALGLLRRSGTQYHWNNAGYATFDDFLETLVSRKRKALKRERRDALPPGLTIEWIAGKDITEALWDAMFAFYMDTGNRKWGSPYLNRKFFSLLGEALAEHVLLVFARRAGKYIAGALNLVGGEAVYGRYWGCTEHHPFLHFEVCYYQAIDYAIAHKLARVEAGAGGEHKLVRGYVPVTTHSAHWIAHDGFRGAIGDFLERERRAVERQNEQLTEHTPFRKGERQ